MPTQSEPGGARASSGPPPHNYPHGVVTIGASAGGVEALRNLVESLSPTLNAAVVIVLHTTANNSGFLDRILAKKSKLPVAYVREGEEPIKPGRIYLAPPDHHLILAGPAMRTTRGPRENRHRPAIDPLFRSAAIYFGPRTIGVILSGCLSDGTSGLIAIKNCGGISIVQHPEEALFPEMPLSALKRDHVDFCVPLREMPGLIETLLNKPLAKVAPMAAPKEIQIESKIASLEGVPEEGVTQLGKTSPLTCPECGGSLWEINYDDFPRFRCHVGHAYSAEDLLAEQMGLGEKALSVVLRAAEEQAAIARRLQEQARKENQQPAVARLQEFEQRAKEVAGTVRQILIK